MERSAFSEISLTIKRRLLLILAVIFIIIFVLIVRVGWIQLVKGPELQKLAVEQWTNDVKIDAMRGKILDRNGYELAVSASCERVDAYMRDIRSEEKKNKNIKNEIAGKLSAILGDKEQDILKKLNMTLSNGNPLNSVTIKRRIEKDQADAIRKLKLPGIIVSEDSKRYYPNNNMLSHVIGFLDTDGNGQEGIEKKYNDVLKGLPGRVIMESDPNRRELQYNISKYDEPVSGKDVVLTIDETIQLFVEKTIEQALIDNKAKAVTAIVMDPTNGDILAMANKPDYNLNDPKNMKNFDSVEDMIKRWNNRAVTFTNEPGSIFKVITASAALSEGVVSDNDTFTCPGYRIVAGGRRRCWKTSGHGTQTFGQILQNSCNVGFMILGERLGREKLYKYIDAFGLGKPTGIDVTFEESGMKIPMNKVGPVELATLSFGQAISVTPIQMTSVFATIANNGKMVEPHLVKEIISNDKDGNITGTKETQPKTVKQVIDEDTAKKLRNYLEDVIAVGGGKKAYVEGYHIAGKTGTAQKAENGVYVNGKYVASFVGMAPVDNPKFVVYVSIDEPDPSNYYAGQIAAPLAGQIFKDIFAYMKIKADDSVNNGDEIVVPNVVGLSTKEASAKLKELGFTVEISGKGSTVADMNPRPGISLKPGMKIVLYASNSKDSNSKVIMPDFSGKSYKEVSSILNSLGLKLNATGQGYAIEQDPEVGEEMTKGSTVNVEFDVYGD